MWKARLLASALESVRSAESETHINCPRPVSFCVRASDREELELWALDRHKCTYLARVFAYAARDFDVSNRAFVSAVLRWRYDG